MSSGRGGRELSNDEVVMALLAALALGVAVAKRDVLLSSVGGWLRRHRVLIDGDAVVTIPYLGGLDMARLLVLGGLVVLVVLALVVRRRRPGD